MIHHMKLSRGPFRAIQSGIKDIEMRLHDEKRQRINAGDLICFTYPKTGETITALVLEKLVYPDFSYIYQLFPKERLGYSADEIASPVDMTQYYPEDEIIKWGVAALVIRLIQQNQ